MRKRPLVAGGVVAALALFLGRDPILDYASKLMNGKDEPAKPVKRRARAESRQELENRLQRQTQCNGECRMSVKDTADYRARKSDRGL